MLHRALLAVVLAFAGVAQPAVPDTVPGRMLTAWLEVFNGGDRDALRRFDETNWPSGVKFLDQDVTFRKVTGGFDLRKIEESTPARITALVQERDSDQFGRLVLDVDAAQKISAIAIRAIPRPAEFPLPHLSETELRSAAERDAQQAAAADRFAGAVLVAKDGRTVFARAYGLSDREHSVPNTLETRFRIGSMNKMFTAVATMQLVQAGKIKLDDTVGAYLKDYPNADVASKVTIRELLSHTGGTGDIFGPEFATHRLELRTVQDYIALYGKRAPLFEPGTKNQYSNYGFVLLGAIVEKVSGQSYYDYVRDHVYRPAGMTSTGSEPESAAVPNRSVGYTRDDGPWKPNADTLPYRGSPAGGGYSTVGDLLRFATALQGNRLLDAAHVAMLTTVPPDSKNPNYAYGFGSYDKNGTRCYGHSGGAPGMNGDLEICGNGYVVVVLANEDPPAAGRVSDYITNRLPER
ncbi:MAG TPA: serine hydrolase domain-containing protein [Candidatus Elarobacter sp.]|jgi:CubicO group peptidase (beta-lactamase class C family)|nr:serine hydrolase domain-containing protein [Candidatus Elarobacter sp.]